MKLEDNICPICLYVYIEPVTMPCEHELCLTCFKQNVEEANFCCPMCRIRISTWARRAARNKTLVNLKRWTDIKRNFPDQVKKRLEGEEEDDEEMNALNVSIKLAEPGEIRSEYEEQLKKLREQRAEERRREQEASELLIKQLQAEEERSRQERVQLQEQDEALARELSETLQTPLVQRTRSAGSQSDNASMEPFLLPQPEDETDPSPYPYPCLTPISSGAGKLCVDKDKVSSMEEGFRRQKVLRDKNLITTQDVAQLEEQFRLNRSQTTVSNSEGLEIDVLTPKAGEGKSTLSTVLSMSSLTSLSQNEILKQMSENLDTPINLLGQDISTSPVFMMPSDIHDEDSKCSTVSCITISSTTSKSTKGNTNEAQRSLSAQSVDSITQELNHFRPIRSCPLTPPRRLPSGKLVEPQLIRTTPRHLNSLDMSSPHEMRLSDIDATSPIMKRRLSQLAEERKDQVKRQSKYTATTGGGISPPRHNSDNENQNPDGVGVTLRGTSETVRETGRVKTTSSRSFDLKDISNSPLQKRPCDVIHSECDDRDNKMRKKMILPLEPTLLEEDVILTHPRDLVKCKKENEGFVRNGTVASKSNRLSRRTKRNVSGHVRYTVSDASSPQPTLMQWFNTGEKQDSKVRGTRNTVDEVDGGVVVEGLCRVQCSPPEGTGVCSSGDASVSKSGRHCRQRKLRRMDDFVYSERSPRKSSKRKLVVSEVIDGYCSDQGSEGSGDFTDISLVKKKNKYNRTTENNGARSRTTENSGVRSKNMEVSSKKIGLKTTKKSLKSSKAGLRQHVGASKTMRDFFRGKAKEGDVDNVLYVGQVDQEEEDRKLAEELQRQFELEAKLKMNCIRLKGTSDEYSFRNNRQKPTSVDV